MQHICISGLTAAGKTTHAMLLAEDLQYDYVSATDILAELCGFDSDTRLWTERGSEITRLRDSLPVDVELDRRLCDLAAGSNPTVFDAWALPWVWKGPMVRVWLNSDIPSRTLKCAVSHIEGPDADHPLRWYSDLINRKDGDARRRFTQLHGFDLYKDHSEFDVWIDNRAYIRERTHESAGRGISAFHPVFRATVQSALTGEPPSGPVLSKAWLGTEFWLRHGGGAPIVFRL